MIIERNTTGIGPWEGSFASCDQERAALYFLAGMLAVAAWAVFS